MNKIEILSVNLNNLKDQYKELQNIVFKGNEVILNQNTNDQLLNCFHDFISIINSFSSNFLVFLEEIESSLDEFDENKQKINSYIFSFNGYIPVLKSLNAEKEMNMFLELKEKSSNLSFGDYKFTTIIDKEANINGMLSYLFFVMHDTFNIIGGENEN